MDYFGKTKRKILLLSRYGLDMQKYSDMAGEISWENSLIRTWLNGIFIDSAFNKEDLNEILQTTLLNSQILDNGESEELQEKVDLEGKQTISLQKTRDRIFLLDAQEVDVYLSDSDSRKCFLSVYATEKGAKTDIDVANWWLRSNNIEKAGTAQMVSSSNTLIEDMTVEGENAVRPAVWIKTY